MTDMLDGSVIRMFRLTDEPGGLALNFSSAGLFLAGVPLLRKTEAEFRQRPASEIASLMRAAYGTDVDQGRLQSSLGLIARALNSGDLALAAIAAVQTRTPELSSQAATRLVEVEKELTKYNYNPDEPRDLHGRWTNDGSASPTSVEPPGTASDQPDDSHPRVAETTPLSNVGNGDASNESPPVAALGDDMMRSIVKNACIAECSESSLATHDYGWKFFNCVRNCMIRHGYDPFLFRS
jgi:hypothetical protein